MAASSIHNPVVQCIHLIPGGLVPGKVVRVRGSTPTVANRFSINLQCGPNTPSDDIAFHFNVRFLEGCVVRNHFLANVWGPEERTGGLPLHRNQSFVTEIRCGPSSFKVSVNGTHFCEFFYRLPYQRITHVSVSGDVKLTSVDFEKGPYRPMPYSTPVQQSLAVPHIRLIAGGIYPGKVVRVKGLTPASASRFSINLQCGPNIEPSDDIALHFNIRFPEGCIVRNHFSLNNWGIEERTGGLPLSRGQVFEVLFLCTRNSIKVTLNGMQFCEFLHRLPYQRINHVKVVGDVILKFIGFN